ncbi:dTDP-4-dehydrorhamnose 3,5-epimerase [Salmonella enterica]|uniref:dTDP-4-dehydrorhamnose 3,5-epimerase n=1 Tax=Salmonella enterica TaxID=28901 RepID=Q9F7J5_SALER|nr:dTDP-6-deoxy-D-glucose-3,5-epimerase [Salmonella enterica]HCM1893599.1 dTDP-4-dehydrorhamnose 3,5-epimerase [Salmonella enterica subsp. diarizonae serovar 57:c:e,n,x,z15]EAY1318519.1 dTDP-4-dehydrorhamnose 3,5-epimerase [Salmonella enterica]EBP9773465.1 dTDP-4-dehydrorhamnose 3,5-epimerase [Salmonella enterica]EBR7329305.1 dTDP-4-dehydrorhamnose 3,5-epimerase [Salmonella enterica]
MKIIETEIPDVFILEPLVFVDERGFFMESFNHRVFETLLDIKVNFVQDNHSKSTKNVVRGLHYQTEPYAQGKLVRCISGAVYDVAVDLRSTSQTYGCWVGVELSALNMRQLWIPEGFAHGFLTLTDNVEFLYKTTNYYNKESERCIRYNDPDLDIIWPISNKDNIIVSDKDKKGILFRDIKK